MQQKTKEIKFSRKLKSFTSQFGEVSHFNFSHKLWRRIRFIFSLISCKNCFEINRRSLTIRIQTAHKLSDTNLHFLAEYFPYSVNRSHLFYICQREHRIFFRITHKKRKKKKNSEKLYISSLSCCTYNHRINAIDSLTASTLVNHKSI